MLAKNIVVNSYPRSASIFFLNLLYMISAEKIYGASIHVPKLVGSKEVIGCTIIRDPIDCISSRLFQGYGGKRFIDTDVDEDLIKSQCEEYLLYMDMSNITKAYTVGFDLIVKSPIEEGIKFLEKHEVLVDRRYCEDIKNKDIWTLMPKERDTIYDGHYPRQIQDNISYIEIRRSVKDSKSIIQAQEAYFDFISKQNN